MEQDVVVNGGEPPPAGPGRIRQAQYDTLALMLCGGIPTPKIADALGVSEASISYYAARKSEAFNAVYDAYRERQVRAQVHHLDRLTSMMDMAYDAVRDALIQKTGSENERKLRKDTAFELMDRAIPQTTKTDASINLTQNNITVQQEVRQTFGAVAERFTELVDLAMRQDPRRHLREGTDALPSAEIDVPEGVLAETTGE